MNSPSELSSKSITHTHWVPWQSLRTVLLLIWLWREVTLLALCLVLVCFSLPNPFVSKSVLNLAFKLFFVFHTRLVSGCSLSEYFFIDMPQAGNCRKKRLAGVGNPLWQSAFPVLSPQVLSSFCYFSFHTCCTLQPQIKTCFCWGLFSRLTACVPFPLYHSLSLICILFQLFCISFWPFFLAAASFPNF